jgi:protein-tyrosine phosphatase
MRYSGNDKSFEVQSPRSCLRQEDAGGKKKLFTDIHCHCLPGLDDGPGTMAEALALCRRLVAEGIETVVATPHQLGRFNGRNDAKKVRDVTLQLNAQLQRTGIQLSILPGGDVRVDERVCRLLQDDQILTLADAGKYILLELPYEIFIDIEPLLIELAAMKIKSIVSHPERHSMLRRQRQVILRWLDIGAYFQIDADSILGNFGQDVCEAAWHFLSSGWALLVATDAHNTSERKPCISDAFNLIRTGLGEDLASLVCIENPARIVNGRDIVRVNGKEEER